MNPPSNAKVDFENFIAEVDGVVICAAIKQAFGSSDHEFLFREGDDFAKFLESIDFDYSDDALRGSLCWFADGSWGDMASSVSFNGIEEYFWSHRSRPDIPAAHQPN